MRRWKPPHERIVLTAALLVAISVPGTLSAAGGPDEMGKATPSLESRSTDQRTEVGDYVSDAWITTKVKAMLLKDEGTTGLAIGVTTEDGVVQLSGFVDKQEQISRAGEIAEGVKGVKRVQNDLRVEE
jgi:osmotically-inducible protein OsmY